MAHSPNLLQNTCKTSSFPDGFVFFSKTGSPGITGFLLQPACWSHNARGICWQSRCLTPTSNKFSPRLSSERLVFSFQTLELLELLLCYDEEWFYKPTGTYKIFFPREVIRTDTRLCFVDQVASCKFARGGFATWCLIMLERTGRIKTGGIVIWIITWSTLYRSIGCNLQVCWKGAICYQKVNHVVEKVAKLWETFWQSPLWPVASIRFRFWRNTIKFAGYNRVEL